MSVIYFLFFSSLVFAFNTQGQDCPKPKGGDHMTLKGGDILLDSFPDGAKVSFQCDDGYRSAGGSAVITCDAGTWSPVRLTCAKRNCGSPGEVENGNIDDFEGTEFGDKIIITCNTGFRLVGRREIFCGITGWMGRLPACEIKTCDPPAKVGNGSLSPDKDVYEYEDFVEYTCLKGFTLNGSKVLSCSEEEIFKPDPPACVLVKCEEPDIAHAEWVSGSLPPFGHLATVTHRCPFGFRMAGTPTSTCDINSKWTPGLPQCVVKTCDPPAKVGNGFLSPDKDVYQYGDVIQYTCLKGFTLNGSKSISCTEEEIFKPDPPKCVVVKCEEPNIAHAEWVSGSRPPYGHLATVTHRCTSGFRMEGEPTSTCDINSKWTPRLPQCVAVRCDEPNITNAVRVSGSQSSYGYLATVTYRCNSGFRMEGAPILKCDINGQWKPGLPKCIAATPTTTKPSVTKKVPTALLMDT